MKKKLLTTLLGTTMLLFQQQGITQTLQLGTLENFTFYTGDGAVTNYGTSTFTGDVGTNLGIISGFEPPTTMTGTFYNADALTQQARIDLLNVYIHLNDLPITGTHAAAFGGGESISPGVYVIGGAGSLGGTLILDGGGNADAAFVIKFQGAMTVGAGTTVVLANGTLASNVFWLAEGAVAMGASVIMKGTSIAHSGAVSMGTGGNLEGRMLSMAGAITFGPGVAGKPVGMTSIPISCVNTCANNTLGTAANFALFSSAGAVANTGISGVIGDIGADFGAISGWEASVVVGSYHNADATTAQAKLDLQAGYNQLFNTPATNTTHTPAFGSGETLFPGVYAIAAAGSLGGEITLDALGDPDAVFIFKFGAAFTVGAGSKIILQNGARRCNIFWISEAAISIGAFAIMKGNFIANNTGAVDMGANGFLEGRLLANGGAVGFNTATAYISYSLCSFTVLPVQLLSFTGSCENQQASIKWSTATETNSSFFTVERSVDGNKWNTAGTVAAAGTAAFQRNYSFTDEGATNAGDYYYRLKQTDADNNFKYGNTIMVKKCGSMKAQNLSVFPNPSAGRFNLLLTGDQRQVSSTEVFNAQGVKIYQSNTFQPSIDLSNKASGVYLIRITSNSKTTTTSVVVDK